MNRPRLIGVDLRGLDCRDGEWCWRDGPRVLKEAEQQTGLTPAALRAWGMQFIRDYLDAFKGQRRKHIWPECGETFISKRGTEHDYGICRPALRVLARSSAHLAYMPYGAAFHLSSHSMASS